MCRPAAGIGDVCGADHLCYPGLTCFSGACAVSSIADMACARAIELDGSLDPGDVVETTGMLTAGAGGTFEAGCRQGITGGAEAIYAVRLDLEGRTGTLRATTDLPASGSTDHPTLPS